MYQFYMCSGSVLLLIGAITFLHFLCRLKGTDGKGGTLISISEALETVALGIFYVVCASYLAGTDMIGVTDNPENPVDVGLNYTKEEVDLNFSLADNEFQSDFGENSSALMGSFGGEYEQFFGDFFKDNATKFEAYRMQRNKHPKSEVDCFYKVFLKHAMLAYSLTQTLVYLINKSIDCKQFGNCDNDPKKERKKSNAYRNTIQIFAAWILPVVFLITLYYAAFKQPMEMPVEKEPFNLKPLYANQDLLHKTTLNTTDSIEIDKIIKNVADIVATQTKKTIKKPKLQSQSQEPEEDEENCDYTKMPLKLHSFVTIILAYILTVLFTQTVRNSEKDWMQKHIQNMRVVSVLWLPAIIELFARLYLSSYMPNTVSDLFTLLGNTSHLLINLTNVLSMKKPENAVTPEGAP